MRATLFAFSILVSTVMCAQDPQWVRDWEEAQRQRPATIGSAGRIAPLAEPGIPMVVRGRVVKADGRTPVPGVIVFAYQTDRSGVYNEAGLPGWRLRGWAKSDAQGRFELRTIRPGSYPGTRTPAHIHVTIDGAGIPRRWAPEIQFADDPFTDRNGRGVLPVTVKNGIQYVDYRIRVEERGKF